MVNLARAALVLNGDSFERTLPLSMPLPYLAGSGLIWGIIFVAAALGVWWLRPWARKLLLAAIVVYQMHIWINHLLFDISGYARQVWPFNAGISSVWIMAVWGFSFLPDIRRLFQPR
jgi:hypothetical protein